MLPTLYQKLHGIAGINQHFLSSPFRKKHPEISDVQLIEKLRMLPYQPGDILYVRETWERFQCCCCEGDEHSGICINRPDEKGGCYMYRATNEISGDARWHPSIHMPKEAARIFLKVKDVSVERLQDITEEQAEKEGVVAESIFEGGEKLPALHWFVGLWDSTIKKLDIEKYGWQANPWVWVIEFERCEKPEG